MGWVPNKEVYIFEHANDIYGTEVLSLPDRPYAATPFP